MKFGLALFLFLASLPVALSEEVARVSVLVDGSQPKAETDDNFICATIDWWPHDKCDYGHCSWGYSSVVNMDLSRPFLAKAIQAFKPLRIRIGGSLQDQVLYDVGTLKSPCHPFRQMNNGLFGYSKGCLHMTRWDELNHFFATTGALVTFGLNALHGRHQLFHTVWGGDWDSGNAHDLINYTISKGYKIDSWEFGNELSGKGIGASVGAAQYANDLIKLRRILDTLYKNSRSKPSLIAPGGFYEKHWYDRLLRVSGSGIVNVLTHHIYNLGPDINNELSGLSFSNFIQGLAFPYFGKLAVEYPICNDWNLEQRILDPGYLSRVGSVFGSLSGTIQNNGPWSTAWVGEAGGAYNSGGRHVSNTFVNSFWYLDQLGMASSYNTKVYCRQTLIGGNYGLINTTTSIPNPDYYSALLFHRLMGKRVLAVSSDASSPYLRIYAHCSKGRKGVTLLLINLSKEIHFILNLRNRVNTQESENAKGIHREKNSFAYHLKKTFSWVGTKGSDVSSREEYHLTPKDENLRSQTMLLNGIPLVLTNGEIPSLNPVRVNVHSPISLSTLSIAFVVYPNFDAPTCVRH